MQTEVLYLVLFSLQIIAVVLGLTWLIALYRKDNSVMDTAYGITFIAIAVYTFFCADMPQDLRASIITLCTILWGSRLSLRIWKRNIKKGYGEDFRYKKWREEWSKRGLVYFHIRSILQIFVLQGIIIAVVALPIVFANSISSIPFSAINFLGLILFCIGFYLEARADNELDTFLRYKKTQAGVLQSGLWKYSRHPNYFGESLIWWGMAIMVVGVAYWPIVFMSPIVITYLLRFVSGIPMVEARYTHDEKYQKYAHQTNAFIPWFPKKL